MRLSALGKGGWPAHATRIGGRRDKSGLVPSACFPGIKGSAGKSVRCRENGGVATSRLTKGYSTPPILYPFVLLSRLGGKGEIVGQETQKGVARKAGEDRGAGPCVEGGLKSPPSKEFVRR